MQGILQISYHLFNDDDDELIFFIAVSQMVIIVLPLCFGLPSESQRSYKNN
jgi:hypothetical protein